MGGGGGQHLDTVQLRRHLLLRYLLPHPQIHPSLRPIHPRLHLRLQGHRRQPLSILGPWVVHAAGAIQCFVGYFFMWLAVTGAIARPNVVVMCVFMFVASQAQTFFNTANVVTSVHNFPDYSGTMVGL
ncbi:UNVERIFIED_CONTAM: hypothetical protein Sangu_0561900 [Sesamum angustifolium]|uniref:Nodulin-like domain-containing protein n=1 Tax=Sesamum angustifolium TaxID=2727405 RepID=A0AAW2QBE0_9LAMI